MIHFTIIGKGESIWDHFVHKPGNIVGGDTGDVATGSYHSYDKDIDALKKLGVYKLNYDYIRFTHVF